jgi:hypothetical protein
MPPLDVMSVPQTSYSPGKKAYGRGISLHSYSFEIYDISRESGKSRRFGG